jgi:hypothetical protein
MSLFFFVPKPSIYSLFGFVFYEPISGGFFFNVWMGMHTPISEQSVLSGAPDPVLVQVSPEELLQAL